jgi:hypothetical protein
MQYTMGSSRNPTFRAPDIELDDELSRRRMLFVFGFCA